MLKKVVVDRVDAEDGPYDVLHLGTGEEDEGKALFWHRLRPSCLLPVCEVWRDTSQKNMKRDNSNNLYLELQGGDNQQ